MPIKRTGTGKIIPLEPGAKRLDYLEVQGAMRAVEAEEVRRNIVERSRPSTQVGYYWHAQYTPQFDVDGVVFEVNTQVGAGTVPIGLDYNSPYSAIEGESYCAAACIENLSDADWHVWLTIRNHDKDNNLSALRNVNVVIPANEKACIESRNLLIGSGTAALSMFLQNRQAGLPVGFRYKVYDGWSIEEDTGQTLTPLYGGMDFTEYDPDPRYSVEWTGEPNNSESILVHRHEIEDITGGANIELTPIEQVTVNGQAIDLQGNFLAALPNGVKDTLTATPEGTTITKRVGMEGGQSFEVEPYTVHLDYSLPPVQGGEVVTIETNIPTADPYWEYVKEGEPEGDYISVNTLTPEDIDDICM